MRAQRRPLLDVLIALSFSLSAATGRAAPATTPAAAPPPGDLKSLRIDFPVEKHVLPNGLTLLLAEDHTVPMISYHTWYKVGSRDERPGITGSAHMLEHMMFQGSKKYSSKELQTLMDRNGIEWNAFTTNDYTGFYMNLPSSKLDLVMDVEVDRMANLTLDPKNLASEHQVVAEERRLRVDNSPFGQLRETMMATVFKTSNYRWPVIGTMKDIEAYTVAPLREFHEKYYVPSNAVLVVAGDINPAKVKKAVEKAYGGLTSRKPPETEHPAEPPQKVQANAHLKRNVQTTSFTVAFQGAPNGHPDLYALDLAAMILGAGSSSRLYQRLVYQKQIASGASSSHSSLRDAGIFSINVTMKPGTPMDEALEIVYNEIYKLRNRPVSDAELRKAKTIVMKGLVDDLTTLDGKARSLASYEITSGSYANLFAELEKYEAVTAADIKRVADARMNQTQRSIVVLEPATPAAAPEAAQ